MSSDNYYIFVLGYDLLQDYFKKQNDSECDIVYQKACQIYNDFLKSEEIKNYNISQYDALIDFLKNNKYIKGV